ncbi:PAAR domain-containing protein [Massilia horti]|uniref:PAAR domain-containing protein n=1 Tax=Massilia horti TaxID=2562153 RepID=A0A4Y9T941_9BURK|nr:PAAR domain-containing protein [Massilia horti]TFW34628.1 PAAR domain-containing protein [Massilia horti]
MIERFHITVGAKTSAGGEVISAADSCRYINDALVAYERDQVRCPKCNSIGYIQPDGPRLSDTFNGKEVALGDDLCICKCNPPPRLIANQDFSCQTIDADWHAEQASAAAETVAELNTAGNSATVPPDTAPLVLLDLKTQEPYRNRPYRLQLKDKVIEGTTDQNGTTRPLTPSERAAVVEWHIIGETTST